MAHVGFGNHITEETLKGMPEYQNKATITRTDKAKVALSRKNDATAQASQYLENLKKEECDCDGVITLVSIYNATGGTITHSVDHDYSGKLAEGSTYPAQIENGLTKYFQHVETSGKSSGSCGAVVYWGKNKDGEACDWMLSWSNPTNKILKVFTEIAERDCYKQAFDDPAWAHVSVELMKSNNISTYEWHGCDSHMKSTYNNDVRIVTVDATVTLKEAKV